MQTKYLIIIILIIAFYCNDLLSDERPLITPMRALNTDLDEYTPFVIKIGDRGIRKGVPWRLYYSQTDAKARNKTCLKYTQLKVTANSDFENDPRTYYIIDHEFTPKTFIDGAACLSIGDEFGLAAGTPARVENILSVKYNDKDIEILNYDTQLSALIKKDFKNSWVSHFSIFPKRYVFFSSDISCVETPNGKVCSKGLHDIWYYIYLRGPGWYGPYNLSKINTNFSENVPVIDINGEHLFFSSNNEEEPKWKGGFDIYFTKIMDVKDYPEHSEKYMKTGLIFDEIYRIDDLVKEDPNSTIKIFDKINTEYDEFGFFRIDLKQAVYCSDKESAKVQGKNNRNFDLYHVTPIPPYTPPGEIGVLVFDCKTKRPLKGVLINLEQEIKGKWVPTDRAQLTSENGEVYFQKLVAAKYRIYADLLEGYKYIPEVVVFENESDNMYQYFDFPLGDCLADTIRLTINFCQDCHTLDSTAIKLLTDSLPRMRQVINHYPNSFFAYVNGHTSKEASREYNCELSYDRAMAVKNWLLGQLGSQFADKFRVVRYGECTALVDEFDSNGSRIESQSEINRRVEVVIYKSQYNAIFDDPARCTKCSESGG